jgi:hypothetical protein
MTRTCPLLVGLLLLISGCGGGSPRLLQSITVSPASADAHSFPDGQVQFIVIGIYSQPPSPSPTTASLWSVLEPKLATISQSGVAQCTPGASGAVTVKAIVPAPCRGTGCTAALLAGTAQLTCP